MPEPNGVSLTPSKATTLYAACAALVDWPRMPPATTREPSVVIVFTWPTQPPPKLDHRLPFHRTRLLADSMPAVVKEPPTTNSLLYGNRLETPENWPPRPGPMGL